MHGYVGLGCNISPAMSTPFRGFPVLSISPNTNTGGSRPSFAVQLHRDEVC